MKLFTLLFVLSFSAFANEIEVQDCQNSQCDNETLEITHVPENISDQEINQAYDITEKTLGNIGREIAGEIVEE